MGTVIKSAGFHAPLIPAGIVDMVAGVAEQCLRRAGSGIDEVEMLINTAVYNEKHLSEPALAALIQDTLEKGNGDGCTAHDARKLCSFDLHSGGGGLLTAIQVMDGFIRSGEIKTGLVTAGDVRPATGETLFYPYPDSAGVVLLSAGPDGEGFVSFRTEVWPEYDRDLESRISWNSGLLKLDIAQKREYALHCATSAVKAIRRFLYDENLRPEEIDLVLSSTSPASFASRLQRSLKWKGKIPGPLPAPEYYSAGMCLALSETFFNGTFRNSRRVLFVTAGAGITISIALYMNG